MRTVLVLPVIMLALTSFTTGQTKAHDGYSGAKQELRDLVREWDEAVVKRDAATLDGLLADEFAFVGGPNKAQYLTSIKSASADTFVESAVSADVEVGSGANRI